MGGAPFVARWCEEISKEAAKDGSGRSIVVYERQGDNLNE
jgi:hypothetical protein